MNNGFHASPVLSANNASKELATSGVEVLAHRPEKKRGFSVQLQFSC
jgi:hypothetical protein